MLVPDEGFTEIRSVRVTPPGTCVGRRVLVSGLAGAGKSTFSRALSAKTGLPLIHLDIHFWKPGWVEPTEEEWREKQRGLLSGDEWIADGNYHATLDLRLERADTVVYLDTPWWVCARRALVRGVRKRPAGFELPNGCNESALRRLRDEWWLVWRIWRSAVLTANLNSKPCRGTGTMWRCTFSAPSARSETSSVHKCRST